MNFLVENTATTAGMAKMSEVPKLTKPFCRFLMAPNIEEIPTTNKE